MDMNMKLYMKIYQFHMKVDQKKRRFQIQELLYIGIYYTNWLFPLCTQPIFGREIQQEVWKMKHPAEGGVH